jgi:hypothetical protein
LAAPNTQEEREQWFLTIMPARQRSALSSRRFSKMDSGTFWSNGWEMLRESISRKKDSPKSMRLIGSLSSSTQPSHGAVSVSSRGLFGFSGCPSTLLSGSLLGDPITLMSCFSSIFGRLPAAKATLLMLRSTQSQQKRIKQFQTRNPK